MHLHIFVVVLLAHAIRSAVLVTRGSPFVNNQIVNYRTSTHSRYETGRPGQAVKGYYSYITPEGRLYKVTYIADERGYRAFGEHLPWSTMSASDGDLPEADPFQGIKKDELNLKVQQPVRKVEKQEKDENKSVVNAAQEEVNITSSSDIEIDHVVKQSTKDEDRISTSSKPSSDISTDAIADPGEPQKDGVIKVVEVAQGAVQTPPEFVSTGPQETIDQTKTVDVTKAAEKVEDIKKEENDNALSTVQKGVQIIPEVVVVKAEDGQVQDVDFSLIEEQSPSATTTNSETMGKLAIHVPLITKVYSLAKTAKSTAKPRKTDRKASRIIRYKLAYHPTYGANALVRIGD